MSFWDIRKQFFRELFTPGTLFLVKHDDSTLGIELGSHLFVLNNITIREEARAGTERCTFLCLYEKELKTIWFDLGSCWGDNIGKYLQKIE